MLGLVDLVFGGWCDTRPDAGEGDREVRDVRSDHQMNADQDGGKFA